MILFWIILIACVVRGVIAVFEKPDAAKVARWARADAARIERIAAGKSVRAYNRNAVIAAVGGGMMMGR